MLGSTLANRYKIEAELGRGGMGIVYRGYDTLLNRPVAIKILSASELSSEDRSHLLAEAQAAAQLNHPNVVTVYDAIEVDNQPFIIMEYIEGRTLRSIPQPTIKESIDFVRLSIKYMLFDLEATRRENQQLRKLLDENSQA